MLLVDKKLFKLFVWANTFCIRPKENVIGQFTARQNIWLMFDILELEQAQISSCQMDLSWKISSKITKNSRVGKSLMDLQKGSWLSPKLITLSGYFNDKRFENWLTSKWYAFLEICETSCLEYETNIEKLLQIKQTPYNRNSIKRNIKDFEGSLRRCNILNYYCNAM